MSERTSRQVQKIERVTDSIIRRRINLIRPKSVRMCTKYLYVIDGRPSEVVCKAYASDRRTVARGPVGIDAKIDVYHPERFATVEEAFKEQKKTGVKHVHPAVIFKVKTAKRRGRPRYCAVPIDPEMEPWAQELAQYFDEFGEDDVFLGPSCVLTNVTNPRSQVVRHSLYEKTVLRRGATIGANATLVCGIEIGRYAFIAAGAVVTRDVGDYALMMGVPAGQVGWMSRHGHRLENPDDEGIMVCPESKFRYKEIEPGVLRCLDLDEEAPLPPELAEGKIRYDEFRKKSDSP